MMRSAVALEGAGSSQVQLMPKEAAGSVAHVKLVGGTSDSGASSWDNTSSPATNRLVYDALAATDSVPEPSPDTVDTSSTNGEVVPYGTCSRPPPLRNPRTSSITYTPGGAITAAVECGITVPLGAVNPVSSSSVRARVPQSIHTVPLAAPAEPPRTCCSSAHTPRAYPLLRQYTAMRPPLPSEPPKITLVPAPPFAIKLPLDAASVEQLSRMLPPAPPPPPKPNASNPDTLIMPSSRHVSATAS